MTSQIKIRLYKQGIGKYETEPDEQENSEKLTFDQRSITVQVMKLTPVSLKNKQKTHLPLNSPLEAELVVFVEPEEPVVLALEEL